VRSNAGCMVPYSLFCDVAGPLIASEYFFKYSHPLEIHLDRPDIYIVQGREPIHSQERPMGVCEYYAVVGFWAWILNDFRSYRSGCGYLLKRFK
jgi:hypothetical protein